MTDNQHIHNIDIVATKDADGLLEAEKQYASSWKKRGGVGAYMAFARKWDRLEHRVEQHGWNIFDAIAQDDRAEGVIDDIRDLRRYLMLVEAEMMAREAVGAQTTHRDNAVREAPPLPYDCTYAEFKELAPPDQKKYEFRDGRYRLVQVHRGDRAVR